LLRTHVRDCPLDIALPRFVAVTAQSRPHCLLAAGSRFFGALDMPCHAPVHHDGLAELAEDDIPRLQVSVDDGTGVGIGDGVADADKLAQELPELHGSFAGPRA